MGIIAKARDAINRVRNYDAETAYLEQATSPIDLEFRMRELDRYKAKRQIWY